MSENKKKKVLPIVGIVFASLVSAAAICLLIVGIVYLTEDVELVYSVSMIIGSVVVLALMFGLVVLCAKAMHVDKLPIIGLSFSVPVLFAAIILLLFGVMTAFSGYDFAIWMLSFGGIMLVASLAALICSIRKLSGRAKVGRTSVIWMALAIIMLCLSTAMLCNVYTMTEGKLEIALYVICPVLMVASIIGIVLSVIKLKKQLHS